MTLEVHSFDPLDLLLQPESRVPETGRPYLAAGYLELLRDAGPSFTARADKRVMLCGGIAINPSNSERWLWSFLMNDAGPHMLALHRAVRRMLEIHPGRIVATTPMGFPQGCRWLLLLGFKRLGTSQELPGQWLYGKV